MKISIKPKKSLPKSRITAYLEININVFLLFHSLEYFDSKRVKFNAVCGHSIQFLPAKEFLSQTSSH